MPFRRTPVDFEAFSFSMFFKSTPSTETSRSPLSACIVDFRCCSYRWWVVWLELAVLVTPIAAAQPIKERSTLDSLTGLAVSGPPGLGPPSATKKASRMPRREGYDSRNDCSTGKIGDVYRLVCCRLGPGAVADDGVDHELAQAARSSPLEFAPCA